MADEYLNLNEPFVKYLMRQIHGLLPTISKVLGVYYDDRIANHRMLLSYLSENEERLLDEIIRPVIPQNIQLLQQKKRKSIDWVNADKVDLNKLISNQDITPTLFSELENTILVIQIPNLYNDYNDLIIIYFESSQTFSLTPYDENILTTSHKQLIGNLIYNHIKISRHEYLKQKKIRDLYNSRLQNLVHENEMSIEKRNKEKEQLTSKLKEYCLLIINNISEKHELSFVFQPDALEKIIESNLPLSEYEHIIREACLFASDCIENNDSKHIFVKSSYVFTENIPKNDNVNSQIQQSPIKKARFDETRELLDDFERTAKSLVAMNKKIIGKNMGEELGKSGSSITQRINTHKDRIRKLMKEYPDNWNIIKMEFKPIINILKEA